MTLIKRIFLDLDDVLNTFTMYALWCVGCDCSRTDYTRYPAECGYDIVAAADKLLHARYAKKRSNDQQFWSKIHRRVWSNAPRSAEFDFLYGLRNHARVFIATKPTDDPECVAGKLEWVQRECPDLSDNLIIGQPKHLLAQPGALLIDDNEDNVIQWQDCGGEAILVPRPWNQNKAFQHMSLRFIKDRVRFFCPSLDEYCSEYFTTD